MLTGSSDQPECCKVDPASSPRVAEVVTLCGGSQGAGLQGPHVTLLSVWAPSPKDKAVFLYFSLKGETRPRSSVAWGVGPQGLGWGCCLSVLLIT